MKAWCIQSIYRGITQFINLLKKNIYCNSMKDTNVPQVPDFTFLSLVIISLPTRIQNINSSCHKERPQDEESTHVAWNSSENSVMLEDDMICGFFRCAMECPRNHWRRTKTTGLNWKTHLYSQQLQLGHQTRNHHLNYWDRQ